MQNTFMSYSEVGDRMNTHITNCSTWELFQHCKVACLLESRVRLVARSLAKEFIFKEALKDALDGWHRTNNPAVAEGELQVAHRQGIRRNYASLNDINSLDVLTNYIRCDRVEPLNWCEGKQTIRYNFEPRKELKLKPPHAIVDRIDGLVFHEGLIYLLVHKPVNRINDHAKFFQQDFINGLKAAIADVVLKEDLQGICYNLIDFGSSGSGGQVFSRQFFDFDPSDLKKTIIKIRKLAPRYNVAMAEPKKCSANLDYCDHNGEPCIYKALCKNEVQPWPRDLYQFAAVNPHHKQQREELLKIVLESSKE